MSSDIVFGRRPNSDNDGQTKAEMESLVRLHQPWLMRYLSRRRGRDEAMDLSQEVFLRFAKAGAKETFANPQAFLQTIATNLLRDRAKNVTAAQERDHLPLEPEIHAANDGDPHEALVARQTLERYEAALMKLKPKTREIFLRRRLDGASYEQIASEWQMSVSGVEKQMIKAIAHIDRALGRR